MTWRGGTGYLAEFRVLLFWEIAETNPLEVCEHSDDRNTIHRRSPTTGDAKQPL